MSRSQQKQLMNQTFLRSREQIVENCVYHPLPIIFPLLGGLAAPQTAVLSWEASPPGPPVLNSSEYDSCGTCYLEVYTMFGPENPGSVHYVRT